MLCNQAFGHDAAADQMVLDDPFEHGRIASGVPGALGVHDGDRPAFADAQAVRLGAQDAALLRQIQLSQTPLEELPRFEPARCVAALRGGLISAEKDVSPGDRHADGNGDLLLFG